MPLSPSERALRARYAAHRSWATTDDPKARTASGRQAFEQRFLDEVDPDRSLPEPERLRRAEHARKAYFTKLALQSARARRERRSIQGHSAGPRRIVDEGVQGDQGAAARKGSS